MRTVSVCLVLGLLAAAGCGEKPAGLITRLSDEAPASAAAPPPSRIAGVMSPATKQDSADSAPAANQDKNFVRKIIYTAEIDLIVESLEKAERELNRLVAGDKGYVSEMNIQGQPGSSRTGTWKLRVPVDRFDGFLEAAAGLGELENRRINSQEVTEEFYDLEARIKNKKVEEARLLKHLEESTAKLKDTLEVEKEVSRVREEIERMEGRIRLLANLTSLTTVTIVLHERLNYVPPQAPSFTTTIARTFAASVQTLTNTGKAVVLFVVAIGPWLPFLLLALVIALRLTRRAGLRLRARPASSTS